MHSVYNVHYFTLKYLCYYFPCVSNLFSNSERSKKHLSEYSNHSSYHCKSWCRKVRAVSPLLLHLPEHKASAPSKPLGALRRCASGITRILQNLRYITEAVINLTLFFTCLDHTTCITLRNWNAIFRFSCKRLIVVSSASRYCFQFYDLSRKPIIVAQSGSDMFSLWDLLRPTALATILDQLFTTSL